MKDFDIAYAFEGLARAHAMLSEQRMAEEFFELARQSGSAIANEEDRSIFMGDFEGGEWYGMK